MDASTKEWIPVNTATAHCADSDFQLPAAADNYFWHHMIVSVAFVVLYYQVAHCQHSANKLHSNKILAAVIYCGQIFLDLTR